MLGAAAAPALTRSARAQSYPSRPVRGGRERELGNVARSASSSPRIPRNGAGWWGSRGSSRS